MAASHLQVSVYLPKTPVMNLRCLTISITVIATSRCAGRLYPLPLRRSLYRSPTQSFGPNHRAGRLRLIHRQLAEVLNPQPCKPMYPVTSMRQDHLSPTRGKEGMITPRVGLHPYRTTSRTPLFARRPSRFRLRQTWPSRPCAVRSDCALRTSRRKGRLVRVHPRTSFRPHLTLSPIRQLLVTLYRPGWVIQRASGRTGELFPRASSTAERTIALTLLQDLFVVS